MPEGPSLVILKEAIQQFKGRKVLESNGYAKEDLGRLKNKKIIDIKTWGKHLLIMFNGFTVRIHLLMFGSYRINEVKETNPKLHMEFSKGEELNFYACSVKIIEGDLDEVYDWSADIMSPEWSTAKAVKKLKEHPDMIACDALLDQTIFSGSGNIVKNEVLWRVKLHPLSNMGALTPKQMTQLAEATHDYAFDFLEWKKKGILKKQWKAHTKKTCPRCDLPLEKEYLGKTKRRTFYCENCQVLRT
jgi:endonuclease-8